VKKKIIISLVVTIALVQASFCFAEDAKERKYAKSDLKTGTTEIGVNFFNAHNIAGVTPFIGYFVTDEIEVGGGFMLEAGDVEGNDYTTTAISLLGRYHIPIEHNIVLFGEVGLEQINAGRDAIGNDISAFIIGVGGRIFPSKTFSMNLSVDYIIGSYNNFDTNALRLGLGLSVFMF
jgi:hypothetical protein